MEESRENPKKFQTKSCFFEKRNRANLLLFSEFGAA
jgi:hypothetical protein